MRTEIAPNAVNDSMTGKHHRVILVTGLAGAGKTVALRTLEDLGWEAIDNFPLRLLDRLLDTPQASGGRGDGMAQLAIGFDSRTRGFDPLTIIDRVKQLSARPDLDVSTLFLDCSGAELERRYNETRRPHPLAQDRSVSDAIAQEREWLEPLRRWSDVVISTTSFATNQLQQAIREYYNPQRAQRATLSVISFGFARGMPPIADLVFDMRFLDNPHWDPELRPMTGRDKPVADYIAANPDFQAAFARIRDLLLFLLPLYEKQGKAYITIAFGCTGGRHRSVFTAEQMAKGLREAGFSPTVSHRNLSSRPANLVEGTPAG